MRFYRDLLPSKEHMSHCNCSSHPYKTRPPEKAAKIHVKNIINVIEIHIKFYAKYCEYLFHFSLDYIKQRKNVNF